MNNSTTLSDFEEEEMMAWMYSHPHITTIDSSSNKESQDDFEETELMSWMDNHPAIPIISIIDVDDDFTYRQSSNEDEDDDAIIMYEQNEVLTSQPLVHRYT